jgi:hypothetical protein
VEARAHKLLDIAEIAGDIVGNAAAAVRDVFALIDHGDLIVRAQAFHAASDFGAQGYGPNNNGMF